MKAIKVEKRLFDENQSSEHMKTTFYAFWGGLSGVCLLLATSAYILSTPKKNTPQTVQIDQRTTASVRSEIPRINVVERRQERADNDQQRRRIEDLTRVISRLRNEQTALNDRLAELDRALTQLQGQTRALNEKVERKVSLSTTQIVTKTQVAQSTDKADITPRPSSTLKPKTVGTNRINQQKAVKQAKEKLINQNIDTTTTASTRPAAPIEDESIRQIQSVGDAGLLKKSVVPKTKAKAAPKGDKQPKLVETSQFAIDLGVNPTKDRAQNLWQNLLGQKRHVLAKLKPRYVLTGNEEEETRLIAGPFVDASDAIRACVSLRSVKAFCKTTLFQN